MRGRCDSASGLSAAHDRAGDSPALTRKEHSLTVAALFGKEHSLAVAALLGVQVLEASGLTKSRISSSSGKRPTSCLHQTWVPSTCTSKTPPAPSISSDSTWNACFSASAKLAARGR